MNPIIKKDILNVLRASVEIVKNNELLKLREISDHVIHNASVFQDKDSITIAVTIYALSKMQAIKKDIGRFALIHLINAVDFLERGEEEKYEDEMKNIMQDISKNDEKTKFYIQEVFELAQIKKGSKMFEHGISMGQVADSLGISLWDLMEYIGKTRIADQLETKPDLLNKLIFTRGLFGVQK
jgi:hypothetical protein